MSHDFDVIVIGGGHAGAEAAWAAANLLLPHGGRVALVSMDPSRTGQMSCNPAIGGLAKGQIVREVDALGGLMGLAADATGIQFRMLNASRGPAVRGPRCQSDKYAYAREVQRLLGTRTNLQIMAGMVEGILTENGRCAGVSLRPPGAPGPQPLTAGAVVLTTGTFMRGLMHRGEEKTPGGRTGEGSAQSISPHLRSLGFELGRLKTGTPPRLDARTIDFAGLAVQSGDARPIPFSEMSGRHAHPGDPAYREVDHRFPVLEQRPCWITATHQAIHDLIRANLHRAPMYNGQIQTAGPRYCPSIEDKVVRFADKARHQIFLEPESLETHEIYCNGISTSLPPDVQEQMVHALGGCERARILRYGYAVEYDMVLPHQVDATTMTKRVAGFFLAGQINGTTGYEEAAGQGVLAGLNAARYVRDQEPVRLRRDQAYIGVLMDDLTTKVPTEPYRMFTSRAEHRLRLRADNAPQRLTPLGREWGLVDAPRWAAYRQRCDATEVLEEWLRGTRHNGATLYDWMKNPALDEQAVQRRVQGAALPALARDPQVIAALCSEARYAPYILRQQRELERWAVMEERPLPRTMDYRALTGMRTEAREVLERFRPATFGQAGRLAGINPADLTVLVLALAKR